MMFVSEAPREWSSRWWYSWQSEVDAEQGSAVLEFFEPGYNLVLAGAKLCQYYSTRTLQVVKLEPPEITKY